MSYLIKKEFGYGKGKMGKTYSRFSKLKGFTQERFAKKLGISVSVLGEIERGNRMPKLDIIEQMSACTAN